MSYSKRASERENDCPDDAVVDNHCELCGEFESECICPDVATEGRAFFPGDEVALADAIDSHVTRTQPHPSDGED